MIKLKEIIEGRESWSVEDWSNYHTNLGTYIPKRTQMNLPIQLPEPIKKKRSKSNMDRIMNALKKLLK